MTESQLITALVAISSAIGAAIITHFLGRRQSTEKMRVMRKQIQVQKKQTDALLNLANQQKIQFEKMVEELTNIRLENIELQKNMMEILKRNQETQALAATYQREITTKQTALTEKQREWKEYMDMWGGLIDLATKVEKLKGQRKKK